jgi:hypothetical protein
MRTFLHRTPLSRKLGLLAVAVLFVVAVVSAPTPAQACHNWTEYFTYYSDATKTVEVGWCEFDCYCVTYCEGQKTSFYNHQLWPGCL